MIFFVLLFLFLQFYYLFFFYSYFVSSPLLLFYLYGCFLQLYLLSQSLRLFFFFSSPSIKLLIPKDSLFNLWEFLLHVILLLFHGCSASTESTCRCRRHRKRWFNPWVRKIPWRRMWLPTPVFLPGKSHGQRTLVECSPWGHKEWDTTKHTARIFFKLTLKDSNDFFSF